MLQIETMRIFVLASRVPYPLEKGDKLRIFHQVRELSKNNHVHLCCLNSGKIHPSAREELSKISSELSIVSLKKKNIIWNLFLNLFSEDPFQVAYFFQRNAAIKINNLIKSFNPDHIYTQLIRTSEYVKNQHDIPKTIDYMDSFSKGMDRRAKSASFFSKPIILSEARRLLRYENLIYDYFENHTIISKQDRDTIWHQQRKNIAVIPNGIDSVFFHPKEEEKEFDILFTGNMAYIPNVDSVVYLVEDILPLIQKEIPNVKVLIAGASPVNKIKNMANNSITVTGWVDDIRNAYWTSKVFVAPLRLGSGLQNKLLEAMATKKPCVTSPLANNALGAVNNKSILIAENAKEFAEKIIYLLKNQSAAREIAENGYDHVISNFDWKSTTEKLEKLMSNSSTIS
ncbi:MAG: glycosyltransferase [Bacteroidetes bacterium]|nr:MAG: glycosyltransferase [Bacteroidota bacterium]